MRTYAAIELLRAAIARREPIMLWGAPGVGKSDIVRQAADSIGYACDDRLRGSHILPDDLKIPVVRGDSAQWVVCGVLREVQDSAAETVLFLDELPAAQPSVQAIFYQLVLDRTLPNGERLRDGVSIIAAGNREADGAVSYRMPTALSSRFTAHITIEAHIDDWTRWAVVAGIDDRIIAFLRSRPALLSDVSRTERASPTPRTWAGVSRILAMGLPAEIEHEALAGAVGTGAAAEFGAYRRLYAALPDPDEIMRHPDSAPVPADPSALYAVATMLGGRATAANLAAVLRYINRCGAEFAVLMMRDALRREAAECARTGKQTTIDRCKAYVHDFCARYGDLLT